MQNNAGFRVVVPPPPGHRSNNGANMLNLDKALQYTPLTASILPAHDRIPLPQVVRSRESARLLLGSERNRIKQALTTVSESKLKERLCNLLDQNALAAIKFKHPPSTSRSSVQDKPLLDSAQLLQDLSPMAKTILRNTQIEYSYLSHVPSAGQINHYHKQTKVKNEPLSTAPKPPQPQPTIPVLQSQPGFPQSTGFTINIPAVGSDFKEHEYERLIDSPKRRKLSHDRDRALRLQSQREAAQAAMTQFQDTLMEIFQAQDSLDGETTGLSSTKEDRFFEFGNQEEDDEPRLNRHTLDRLQSHLRKLGSLKNLSDVPSDQLRRLQQICERPIERAQSLNLKLGSDSTGEDQEEWRRRILAAEHGAASACIYMLTIIGCPQNEDLVSTDPLHWIPNVLVNVFENCIIPVVESRPDGQDAELFVCASTYRDHIKKLLDTARKLLDLQATFCSDVKGGHAYVNAVEFLAAKLIFVQNTISDKNSVLGTQTFEKVRKAAMAALAKFYAKHPQERGAILDEILNSLDKLPSTSRSARQFRLGDGRSIQLISALFMQLVQTTSLDSQKRESREGRDAAGQSAINQDASDSEDDVSVAGVNGNTNGDLSDESSWQKVREKSSRLFTSAVMGAREITSYLVGRASKTTKTGDSPYRNILDLFIEDLITVLPNGEWPAAELLLRLLAARMLELAKNEKAASIKNMALESLGTMGSAISKILASVAHLSTAVSREVQQEPSKIGEHLLKLVELQNIGGGVPQEDLIATDGPLAMLSEHFISQAKQDLHHQAARGYFLAHYVQLVSHTVQQQSESSQVEPSSVIHNLVDMMGLQLSGDMLAPTSQQLTDDQSQLAYVISILNLGFCRRLNEIVKTLTSSVSSDQAQVRTRSLKSVLTVLESDASLLDRDHSIADDVLKCASDESSQVRDSALSIIARFIILRPGLERKGIQRLLECAGDEKVGVQKRAIGHLKDIYFREVPSRDGTEVLKIAIERTILERLGDHEEAIVGLAQQTLEEIWIRPIRGLLQTSADAAKTTVALEKLTRHLIASVTPQPERLVALLKSFLLSILRKDDKALGSDRQVCSRIVEVLFEKVILEDKDQTPLFVLTAFADANPRMIPAARLAKLTNYLSFFKTEADLSMFRSVIGIFRSVLPDLSDTHKALLKEVQDALMQSINKLARRVELDMVMSCLWRIDGIVHNTERLVRLNTSVLKQLQSNKTPPALVQRLLRIEGAIGKHVDLEKQFPMIQKEFPSFKGSSVADLQADTLHALIKGQLTLETRLALESLGSVCQAKPAQFSRRNIRNTLFGILSGRSVSTSDEEGQEHQLVVLRLFDELFGVRATAKGSSAKTAGGEEKQELKQLGGNSKTRDEDSIVSSITQEVVTCVLQIALSRNDENAFLAARTLASISHQGLTHPKQSLGAFVAVGTSRDPRVAKVGVDAQKLLHEQHESHCEREYMSAIHEAFLYQLKVFEDPSGGAQPGNKAKLARCFEIINTSSAKYVKKFLSGLISRAIPESAASQPGSMTLEQMYQTQFTAQNVAFFEYKKVDDLLHVILQLELAYSKCGGEISQSVENKLQLLSETSAMPTLQTPAAVPDVGSEINMMNEVHGAIPAQALPRLPTIDPTLLLELKRLTPAIVSVTLLIEVCSYLKKQYSIGRDVRAAISKTKQAKDVSKAPVRIHGITGDRFWQKTSNLVASVNDENAVISLCRDFVSQISVDDEVDLANDIDTQDNDASVALAGTGVNPAMANGHLKPLDSTPGNRKRRGTGSFGNTPTKRPRGGGRKSSTYSRRSGSVSSRDELDFEHGH